jgi:hypothetical protein
MYRIHVNIVCIQSSLCPVYCIITHVQVIDICILHSVVFIESNYNVYNQSNTT